jgi:hypothetical protein
MHRSLTQLGSLSLCAGALAQSITVPAPFVDTDGVGLGGLPGVTQRYRQQVIYGGTHLVALHGQVVNDLRFRRDGYFTRQLTGGRAELAIDMSTTARAASHASPVFADNHGVDLTAVFAGTIDIPNSPALSHRNEATWVAPHALTIPLSRGLLYVGGQLVVDVRGTPDPTAPSTWWPIDVHTELIAGSVAPVGVPCDPRNFLSVAREQLVLGSSVRVVSGGPPAGQSLLALAALRLPPIDLGFLGFPGCTLQVPLELTIATNLRAWRDGTHGFANHVLHLPLLPNLVGSALSVQALTVTIGQTFVPILATSRALDLVLAGQLPTLDAATVRSGLLRPNDPWPNSGLVSTTRVPVTRFGW